MKVSERYAAFAKLGGRLRSLAAADHPGLAGVLSRAEAENPWFTPSNQLAALSAIGNRLLDEQVLQRWLAGYGGIDDTVSRTVGVIMAGNIPAAGFHDLLCVLMAGHRFLGKTSRDDDVLIRWLAGQLTEIEPRFVDLIRFADKLTHADAFIGTGSNNSARYFEYYFREKPSLIRRNRNGVAVLTGDEQGEELLALGNDIFSYFGLGCRNVSKLYVPAGYDFGSFFGAMAPYHTVMQHNKYMNNHDYYRTVLLMNKVPFLTNDFLIVTEKEDFASPVSVLYYQHYGTREALADDLARHHDVIQCIAGPSAPGGLSFGATQQPGAADYPDGRDTMQFLLSVG